MGCWLKSRWRWRCNEVLVEVQLEVQVGAKVHHVELNVQVHSVGVELYVLVHPVDMEVQVKMHPV